MIGDVAGVGLTAGWLDVSSATVFTEMDNKMLVRKNQRGHSHQAIYSIGDARCCKVHILQICDWFLAQRNVRQMAL